MVINITDLEVSKEPLYTRLDSVVLEALRVKMAKELGIKKGNMEIIITRAMKLYVATEKYTEPIEHTCVYCGHTTFYSKDVLYSTCPECGKIERI